MGPTHKLSISIINLNDGRTQQSEYTSRNGVFEIYLCLFCHVHTPMSSKSIEILFAVRLTHNTMCSDVTLSKPSTLYDCFAHCTLLIRTIPDIKDSYMPQSAKVIEMLLLARR